MNQDTKLFGIMVLFAISFMVLFSVVQCSSEEEDTSPPPSIVITPKPEPEPTPAPVQYTLTVTAGEGGTVSSSGGTYDEGTSVTITANTNYGWRFKRWSNDEFNTVINLTVNNNSTIYAEFEKLPQNLISFYEKHGGRDAFEPLQVLALETLLFVESDIDENNSDFARKRMDYVFTILPLSDDRWFNISLNTENTNSHCKSCPINIGGPVAYYGLRMLNQILNFGNESNGKSIEMTAVIANCAQVTRPTLPDLSPETVELYISPKITENDFEVLKISTSIFRKWVQSITGGYEVKLNFYIVEDCINVNFTDDGEIIRSYISNTQSFIDKVPLDLAEKTDFWWTIAPSGVPGDGSGFNRHFITGGMGGYKRIGDTRYNRPLTLSDDAWFVRKPEHMGIGDYDEIELRAYQPQYFQHEFMHYLYAIWEQFDLERLGGSGFHGWFDRNRWPSDFEGKFEPDYYAETIEKRLIGASPSLSEGLEFPGSPILSLLDPYNYTIQEIDLIMGNYQREPIENGYHEVSIINESNNLKWKNAAGVSWTLEIKDGKLWSGPDCVYGEQMLGVYIQNNKVLALVFNGEKYSKVEN